MTPRPVPTDGFYIDDEVTTERRVRLPNEISSRLTTKMERIDARLIAISKGEAEPDTLRPRANDDLVALDDPFGGLIPVDEDAADLQALDDEWLVEEYTPSPIVAHEIPLAAVPQLCMTASRLVALPLDHRSGFVLSHIDGDRSVEELMDIANLSTNDTLEALANLANLGAITID